MYGGPWANRLDDGHFVVALVGFAGVTAASAWAAWRVWRGSRPGTGRRRAAAGRGRVLDRLRAAHPLDRRGGSGGLAGCGMATAAMTFELFTPRRFSHA
jgi:hypothetical protein